MTMKNDWSITRILASDWLTLCRLFTQLELYFYSDAYSMTTEGPSEQKKDQPSETQTRVCKTCGLEKTVDHFISLYTDMVTHNCDYCRYRQRQQYKGMTLFVSVNG